MKNWFKIALFTAVAVIILLWPDWPIIAQETQDNSITDSIVIKLQNSDRVHKIDLLPDEDIDVILERLAKEPQIEYVTPNFRYEIAKTPNDSHYDSQWYLEKIGAPDAWKTTTGSHDVVIAVLDTGVDINHPDLSANIWHNNNEIPDNGLDDDNNGYIDDYYGWDFISESADPLPKYDDDWTESGIHHGTVVAGVAGAEGNNSIGISGLNWNTKIMPIRVLDGAGLGDTSNVYKGIQYAINNGADFINLSFVGDNLDSLLNSAIEEAWEAGIIVFAAAGNNNINLNDSPRYPVCNEYVIGVGGTDRDDFRWTLQSGDQSNGGSNYGSNCVDISAPATGFIGTIFYDPDNGLTTYYMSGWSGTSLATPLVSASAALIKSHEPEADADQIIQLLLEQAENIDLLNPSLIGHLGSGRLELGSIFEQTIISPTIKNIVAGAGNGGGPHVRIFDKNGNLQSQFFAYAETFRGGVNVAAGDLDGDGIEEIITGVGNGGGPHVRIFDKNGNLQSQFFAYAETFRSGVNVAAGDLDGDGIEEIITGVGNGGGPHVRIFDKNGNLQSQFFAYAETFRGGVNVAAGDLDGDGIEEIITGVGNGGGPQVRVFDRYGTPVFTPGFFAYAETFRGGVNVAAGDLDGDGIEEIITGVGNGGGPQVRVFDRYGTPVFTPGFFAYAETFRGGVNVAAGDLDGDGIEEIVAGAGYTGGPQVRTFDRYGTPVFTPGFFAYAETFRGGVNVSTVKQD